MNTALLFGIMGLVPLIAFVSVEGAYSIVNKINERFFPNSIQARRLK